MATNIIEIDFEPCEPAPTCGYLVKYRPLGSSDDFRTVSPNPTESPVTIVDENDPDGTSYEGTIQGDCCGDVGVPVPWEAINDISGSAGGDESEPTPSEPCNGNPTAGVLDNDEGTICAGLLENLYLDEAHIIIQPGAVLYFDACLTELVIGFMFVKDADGNIFNLDPDEGIVGGPTGNAC